MKNHEYKVYRTFKIVIEAESIEEAQAIADETDMCRWDFDCQEIEPLDS